MRRTALLLTVAALLTAGCGATDGTPDGAGSAATTLPSAPAPEASGGPTPEASGDPASGASGAPEEAPDPAGGGEETAVAAGGTTVAFRGHVVAGRSQLLRRLRYSWRRGCPVGPVELRLLQVDHWGFDRQVHRGELVVHRDQATRILRVLKTLFDARYPIQRLRLVDAYRANDDLSMAANNTSGFNCRRVSGTSRWSEHAYGRAIDLNPLRNPYVTRGGRVSPPAGRPYANRALRAAGMIHDGDRVVRAFAAARWKWGGRWSGSRDYQHFSATGR